jgi:hypothetical protein
MSMRRDCAHIHAGRAGHPGRQLAKNGLQTGIKKPACAGFYFMHRGGVLKFSCGSEHVSSAFRAAVSLNEISREFH